MILPLRGVRFRTRQTIKPAVEQSVRRLVQQDAVVGIRRISDAWKRVLHIGGDYFLSLKQCDCSKKMFSLLLIQMMPLIIEFIHT